MNIEEKNILHDNEALTKVIISGGGGGGGGGSMLRYLIKWFVFEHCYVWVYFKLFVNHDVHISIECLTFKWYNQQDEPRMGVPYIDCHVSTLKKNNNKKRFIKMFKSLGFNHQFLTDLLSVLVDSDCTISNS